jgi:Fe-S cluster assembly protein SufD
MEGFPARTGRAANVVSAAPNPDARTQGPALPPFAERLKAQGREAFEKLGFPSPKSEDWRGTSPGPLARNFPRAPVSGVPSTRLEAAVRRHVLDADAPRLVFLDGRFERDLSRVPSVDGLTVSSLTEAFHEHGKVVERNLGQWALPDTPFAAQSLAHLEEGAFVLFAAGRAVRTPVELIFLASGAAGASPVASYPRILIVAERGSQGSVVQTFAAVEEAGSYYTNAVTEIVAEENATLGVSQIQLEGTAAPVVETTQIVQDRSSNVTHRAFVFGGSLARHDINGRFRGEGAELVLDGLFLARGRQHMDNHTRIDHAEPHCASREFYKGILLDEARGVFFGRIVVRPGAQKTDAKQTNKNLVLSGRALVDSTPQLEIYADDVKCTHASATGQLEEEAVFYLRTRGLDEATAKSVLTHAFALDVTDRVQNALLRERVDELVRARLEAGPTKALPTAGVR